LLLQGQANSLGLPISVFEDFSMQKVLRFPCKRVMAGNVSIATNIFDHIKLTMLLSKKTAGCLYPAVFYIKLAGNGNFPPARQPKPPWCRWRQTVFSSHIENNQPGRLIEADQSLSAIALPECII
jgi:hypothetical protein